MSEVSTHIASQFRKKAKELPRYAHTQSRRRAAILGFARNFEIFADCYEEGLRAKPPRAYSMNDGSFLSISRK